MALFDPLSSRSLYPCLHSSRSSWCRKVTASVFSSILMICHFFLNLSPFLWKTSGRIVFLSSHLSNKHLAFCQRHQSNITCYILTLVSQLLSAYGELKFWYFNFAEHYVPWSPTWLPRFEGCLYPTFRDGFPKGLKMWFHQSYRLPSWCCFWKDKKRACISNLTVSLWWMSLLFDRETNAIKLYLCSTNEWIIEGVSE